jgi:hypothetical protein
MNADFLIGALIVIVGGWALTGFAYVLAKREMGRRLTGETSRSTGISCSNAIHGRG